MKTLAACSMLVSSLYEPLALRGTLAATFFTSALSVTVHEKADAATFFTLDCARKGSCRRSLHLLFWQPCSQCWLLCKATPWQSLQQFITRLCSQMPDPMPTLQRLLLRFCSQKPPPLHSLQRALTRTCSQHFSGAASLSQTACSGIGGGGGGGGAALCAESDSCSPFICVKSSLVSCSLLAALHQQRLLFAHELLLREDALVQQRLGIAQPLHVGLVHARLPPVAVSSRAPAPAPVLSDLDQLAF